MLQDAIDLSLVRRALVVKLRHHGDVLLTSPVFTVLKNHAPHAEIDALVYRDTQEMLTGHPAIGNVFTLERSSRLNWVQRFAQEMRLIRALRARRYDLLIHLTEHRRGARLVKWLRPRWSVCLDHGSSRRSWRRIFTHLYRLSPKPRHVVEQHLDALRRIGIQPGPDERRLVLVPGEEAETSVGAWVPETGFIHLHPTSRWQFKGWEIEKCAALIRSLQAAGERIVVTAAPDPEELATVKRILGLLEKPVTDLSGRVTLKQLAALVRRAKCFVGVDSAPMHIAAAMGTPVVALFGPSGDQEWGPWQVPSRVITMPFSCRPCGLDGCGGGKVSECLTSIPVETVLEAVRSLCPK